MVDLTVLDASVAAKWFLRDEQHIEQADELLLRLLADDLEMYAPRVIFYEVCQLLNKACRQFDPGTGAPRLTKDQAIQSVREFLDLPVCILDTTAEEYVEALDIAVAHSRRSHADMTYIKLAERLDCKWCTGDDTVLNGVSGTFPSDYVLLLSTM
jgi:predicted nucleic acid-binding protein